MAEAAAPAACATHAQVRTRLQGSCLPPSLCIAVQPAGPRYAALPVRNGYEAKLTVTMC